MEVFSARGISFPGEALEEGDAKLALITVLEISAFGVLRLKNCGCENCARAKRIADVVIAVIEREMAETAGNN